MRTMLMSMGLLFVAAGCDGASAPKGEAPSPSPHSHENILSLNIEGMSFVGPREIKSGWTTIRINNTSGMTHHGLLYRLPDGVTAEMVADQVINPFQESLTASINGDAEGAARIFQSLPGWIADFVYLGGPGMISAGVVGETTMFLEPGNYIIECYVKTNGVQHNYNPVPGALGMVLPLTVLAEAGGMAEPEANVTLEIANSGYAVSDGDFAIGENSVRVKFVEQTLYGGLVGHDAHFFAIAPDTDVEAAAKWVDFFPVDGQQTPAPARYVGGIHDMPEGSTAYIRLHLDEGRYGIVAEVPGALESGHFKEIAVTSRQP